VRAYSREQELDADQRAIEILRDMGHLAPRRVLASALRAAANPSASPLFEQRILAREPELEARVAALEPLEATTFVAGRKAAARR
jgi:Zn-dependent protease with chaperone function